MVEKRFNSKGFTLIELLAVITIMGILMMAAIPAISKTIENSRKDTFLNTMVNYCTSAKSMWAADNFACTYGGHTYSSSAVDFGDYYIMVDSSVTDDSVPKLLEQGGKSAWGNRDIKGYIKITKAVNKKSVLAFPVLSDGVHGVNTQPGGALQTETDLVRGRIKMSGQDYPAAPPAGSVICVEQ